MLTLNLSLKGSELNTRLRDPIKLPGELYDHEVALHSCSFYNSIVNIQTGVNDTFDYTVSAVQKQVVLPQGAYEISQIDDVIQQGVLDNGDSTNADTPRFSIQPNFTTLGTTVVIDSSYAVGDQTVLFNTATSVRNLLGFNSQILSGAYEYQSDDVANITGGIDSLRFTLNFIEGSYSNGSSNGISDTSQVIYATSRKVSPGFLQTEDVNNLIWLPINTTTISDINIRFVDQQNRPLPISDKETTNITLVIRDRF